MEARIARRDTRTGWGGRLCRGALAATVALTFCWPAGVQMAWADEGEPVDTFADANTRVGSGTEADPYVISTEADLQGLSKAVNADKKTSTTTKGSYSGKYFVLANDITLSSAFTPIGSGSSYYFDSNFDGQGHTISGLTTAGATNYESLFGYVKATFNDVTIKNLKVNGSVTGKVGSSTYAGGLIAYSTTNGTKMYKGIVGHVTISNCVADVDVSGFKNTGGLVGSGNSRVTINNCLASGDVTAVDNGSTSASFDGGIVGLWTTATDALMSNCLYTGQVIPSASISGDSTLNALIGKSIASPSSMLTNDYYVAQSSEYVKAYNNGSASFDGGDMIIANGTTASEIVTKLNTNNGGAWAVDGATNTPVPAIFAQSADTPVTKCTVTFDPNGGTMTGESSVEVDAGETIAQPVAPQKDGYEFGGWLTEAGDVFDFDAGITDDITLIASWKLAGTFPGEADGSISNPYIITTEDDLQKLAASVNGYTVVNGEWVPSETAANSYEGKLVKLAADISLTKAFTPIGIGVNPSSVNASPISFKGTFDGQGHTISGLNVTAASNPAFGENTAETKHDAGSFSGLFGSLQDATVQNLGVTVASSDLGTFSGGLVGQICGGNTVIKCCYVDGDIKSSGAGPVGGLIGSYNAGNGTATLNLSYSYHNGDVSSTSMSGGLVGQIGNTGFAAIGCYQHGSVTGGTEYFLGSLAGAGNVSASFTNCVTSDTGSLLSKNLSSAGSTTEGCISGATDWSSAEVKSALGDTYYVYGTADQSPTFGNTPSAIAYAVSFTVGEGVTGTVPASTKAESGSSFTIPSSSLKLGGKDFLGWKIAGSSEETLYNAGDVIIVPEGGAELVAQWKEHVHNLVHVAAKDATCMENGNKEYWHCDSCDGYFSDEAATESITAASTVLYATGHSVAHVEAKTATCTEDGNIEYWCCENCGSCFGDQAATTFIEPASVVISKTGHSISHVDAKPATCTENGNIEYWYCSSCDSYFSDEAATTMIAEDSVIESAKGHTLNHVAAKAATCTEDGNAEYWQCSTCQALFSDSEGTVPTTLESVTIPAGHNIQAVAVKLATCTDDGVKAHWTCSACGKLFSDEKGVTEVQEADLLIPARGHEWGQWISVSDSTHERVCTHTEATAEYAACNAKESRNVSTPSHIHSIVTIPGKDATCTEAGLTEGSKCSSCGIVIKAQETVPALGHQFGEWVVTTPATVEAEGVETRTCTVCGEAETRAIDKIAGGSDADVSQVKVGTKVTSSGIAYQVSSTGKVKITSLSKAIKAKKTVTIPSTIKVKGKTCKVVGISSSALKGSKATTLVIKSKQLTKKGVKNSLKGSNIKTVKIKVSTSKKTNKVYVTKYKKYFTQKNCGKKVSLIAA